MYRATRQGVGQETRIGRLENAFAACSAKFGAPQRQLKLTVARDFALGGERRAAMAPQPTKNRGCAVMSAKTAPMMTAPVRDQSVKRASAGQCRAFPVNSTKTENAKMTTKTRKISPTT
jgi:hypothetical protein